MSEEGKEPTGGEREMREKIEEEYERKQSKGENVIGTLGKRLTMQGNQDTRGCIPMWISTEQTEH